LRALFAALVIGLIAAGCQAATLDAYTEELPPYNFTDESGAPAGIAVDLLRAVCAEAALTCNIRIVPWARAYRDALTKPDCLVFSTTRTPERESSLLWVGPIARRTVWLYARADSQLTVKGPQDLRGLRIGAINQDWIADSMKRLGPNAFDIEPAPNLETNVLKLMNGRIDVLPSVSTELAWYLRKHGYDQNSVRPLFKLLDDLGLYFAVNPKTNPETVQALGKAFDKVAASQAYDQIFSKYLADAAAPR